MYVISDFVRHQTLDCCGETERRFFWSKVRFLWVFSYMFVAVVVCLSFDASIRSLNFFGVFFVVQICNDHTSRSLEISLCSFVNLAVFQSTCSLDVSFLKQVFCSSERSNFWSHMTYLTE